MVAPGMPGLEGERGANVNGPSLVRAPDWAAPTLGRYYLYFAHHRAPEIRLAVADRLEGPWTVQSAAVLELADTAARDHIASPDVHVDDRRREVRMYFHGCGPDDPRRQVSFLATSTDGLRFDASPRVLAPFYLRVFEHGGAFYGVAKRANRSGLLLRSPDGVEPFQTGPTIVPRMRHAAVWKCDGTAWLLYSRIGDAPESIMAARLDLERDWRIWRVRGGSVVLTPELPYEGAGEPVEPSRPGAAGGRRCELRDPAVYVEGDRAFLLYAVAGEQGIALAELR